MISRRVWRVGRIMVELVGRREDLWDCWWMVCRMIREREG